MMQMVKHLKAIICKAFPSSQNSKVNLAIFSFFRAMNTLSRMAEVTKTQLTAISILPTA